MNFALNEEQQMIRNQARDFADRELAMVITEFDKRNEFPKLLVNKGFELGFAQVPWEEKYGGTNDGFLAYYCLLEELARVDCSYAFTFAAHCSMGIGSIINGGTEAQKLKWIPRLAAGEFLAAFAFTESNSGSDIRGTQTIAYQKGKEWILNGSKCFVANVNRAGCIIATAVRDWDRDTTGFCSFIVPKDAEGIIISSPYEKLGLNGVEICEVFFDNVYLSDEELIGGIPGQGYPKLMLVLDDARIALGALGVGVAQGCLEASLKYSERRKQFGKPINSFQTPAFKMADLYARIEMARLLLAKAAWAKDNNLPYSVYATAGKLVSAILSVDAARDAVQIHGGYGCLKDYGIEKYYRDAKLLEICVGTNEVQQLVLARLLGCPVK